MSLLSVQNLSVAIDGNAILREVSFDVQAGEICAVTGESGSGKSMTALSIMGLLPKGSEATGQIVFDGQDLLSMTEPAMCSVRGNTIGMVFQEPMTALNPVKPIGTQVQETIMIHNAMPRDAAKARTYEILERVGLPPQAVSPSKFPHQLSGGQRQRVVIAMAIALRPKLLIADEPTTALDVTTQAQILDLLTGLAKEHGLGLLMITHDLAVVAQMAQSIVVMQEGAIVEKGTLPRFLTGMTHPYSKQLFDAARHQVVLPPRPEPEPLLNVRHVIRDYPLPRKRIFAQPGTFRALNGVSLTVNKGERVGLVGESGCGKSTLTRAILGLDPIQGGQISVNGKQVFSGTRPEPSLRSKLQVVFQDPYGSFNPRHRVARLISEPFHALAHPPDRETRSERVADMLTAVGLSPDDADKYPHQFSGGQRQRIAIARALITRPELIIFDEAVSALDVSVRAQVLDLIADLCRQYTLTYLFISHDLSVVRSVTDRVFVMQSGSIVEAGETAQVLARPNHPYTKALIAAAPRLPDNTDLDTRASHSLSLAGDHS